MKSVCWNKLVYGTRLSSGCVLLRCEGKAVTTHMASRPFLQFHPFSHFRFQFSSHDVPQMT
ncbi:hypothetical protein O3P69_000913 [Scylla paramamosain]|uniref:Uncharacterized protein n=1 Tax=Scylla paramamosain TaxID=85552 RepID=A0AAW0US98_SCYPA